MDNALLIVDSYRLFFEAANLFDQVGLNERCIDCFQNTIKSSKCELAVDHYDMALDSMEYQRKIERMNKQKLQEFLVHRSKLRNKLLIQEILRNRLCQILSYLKLLRIYLFGDNLKEAHNCVCQTVGLIDPDSLVEKTEILTILHILLKEYLVCL